jgi:hypothetical protein
MKHGRPYFPSYIMTMEISRMLHISTKLTLEEGR